MKHIEVDLSKAIAFVDKGNFNQKCKLCAENDLKLKNKTGVGSDFLGWYDFPNKISDDLVYRINETASILRKNSEIIVVIGIGGSYLGAEAIINTLSGHFHCSKNNKPHIIFAGQNLSGDYHSELLSFLSGKKFSLIVISKSGTTTEPAIAFRLLRKELERSVGKEQAAKQIVAITDPNQGALRKLALQEKYTLFEIPSDIGGRYSVLSPVGLLPVACAGFDIQQLINGAKSMFEISNSNYAENPVYQYAALRHIFYSDSKTIEIIANYNPLLKSFSEWWKQLFGESEGKDKKGIFPVSVSYTTDLHSLGQYVQDGMRNIFETVLSVEIDKFDLKIPKDNLDLDNINYIAGKELGYVNKMAELGTILAHVSGGVPNIVIKIPELSEFYLGQLFYFFQKACAISGYLLGVNPFDQPGVESYKKNMFALLGKAGFEKDISEI